MKNKFSVQGIDITHKKVNEEDYISLTDIAKFREGQFPSAVISSWMRGRNAVDFLGTWEELNNPEFNSIGFDRIDKEAGRNGFILTPTRWVETTNAIGIIEKRGRYADVLAHKDIAFKFASWLSVKFELYIIKEFQRLKEQENKLLEWTAKRELAKINYHIHTDSIKEDLIPTLRQSQITYVYQDEADMLNVVLFGQTAKEWRDKNPDKAKDGNMRDYTTVDKLLVLANLESYNAMLIKQKLPQSERIVLLNEMARTQMQSLQKAKMRTDKLLPTKKGE